MAGFETKTFRVIDIKTKGEGRFHAVANAYGMLDSYKEIVDPGCFKRSLDQRGPKRVHLWQHSIYDPIGSGMHAETPTSLEVDGKLNLGVQRGRECYELMKEGDIDHMSIGYDVIKDYIDDDGFRHLAEGRLWESSPVTFAANEGAIVDAVKANGYGRQDLSFVLEVLQTISDPVSDIVTRHQAGKLTIKDRQDAVKASSILQELIDQNGGAGPGNHPTSAVGDDPQPAEQLSDSGLHSLMEISRSIRASIER